MRTRLILIAEDEENDVFFLKRGFQKAGVPNPLSVVETGQDVVNYLSGKGEYADRKAHPIPGLLLLDLKMPCLGGAEVLRWIRNESSCRRLPVVVFTSSSLDSDIKEAYDSGANSYVVKPSDPEKLVELLRDLSNWWLKQNVDSE